MQLAEGKYRAKAVEWVLAESSTGTPQLAIQFDLLDYEGSITGYIYFTDKAWERSVESMRHCGWVGDDLEQLDTLGTNEVQIVVENEEYPKGSGQWSPKVKWINAAGAGIGVKKQMDAGGVKTFAASMRSKIRALDPEAAKAAAKAQAATKVAQQALNGPNDAGGPTDDIPF